MIDLSVDRRLRQNLRGLLEGGRRHEGVRREGSLGDSQHRALSLRGFFPFLYKALVFVLEVEAVHRCAGDEAGVVRLADPLLLHHLMDDHLDMLIVDLDTLKAVDPLDLGDHVILHRLDSLDPKEIVGIDGALGQGVPGLKPLSLIDLRTDPGAIGNQVGLRLPALIIRDDDLPLLSLLDLRHAGDLRQNREPLRLSGLKELLDSGKTLGDISSRHASGVEGSHRELGSRLPDGLRGDRADGLSDLHRLPGRKVCPVALRAYPGAGAAGQNRPDADGIAARFIESGDDLRRSLRRHHVIRPDDDLSGLRIRHILRDESPGDSLLQRLYLLLSVGEGRDLHGGDRVSPRRAVQIPDDEILGDIDKTPREIAGVRGAECRVGESLPRSVGGDEILEHVEALPEV